MVLNVTADVDHVTTGGNHSRTAALTHQTACQRSPQLLCTYADPNYGFLWLSEAVVEQA